MHEYSLSYHDRKKVYYFLAIISGSLGFLVAYLLNSFQNIFGFVIAAPSGIALFGVTFMVFDHLIWRIPIFYATGIIKIPNLNGTWIATIKSSKDDLADIGAKITIHQTYSKICIRLETEKSQSLSKMAVIEMADPTFFNLRYEYSAEYQRDQNAEILRHYGVTCLALKSDNHKFLNHQLANYYTELGRDTHGSMKVLKHES
jgi:hypothetical protein